MSPTQRRKMKKLRKAQCEILESACELVGIKVIYTRRNHVRLFWATEGTFNKWGHADYLGPEVSIGKQANKRLDELLRYGNADRI